MGFRHGAFTLLGICSLLTKIPSVKSQFGVAGRKKQRGTTFEDLNELAKERDARGSVPGLDVDAFADLGLDDLLSMDEDSMARMLENAMKNPEMAKLMEGMTGNMENIDMNAMQDQLKQTMELLQDPEALAAEVKKTMEALSSEDALNAILENKEELLDQMGKTGLLSDEVLEQYRENPEKIAEDMKQAMEQVNTVFDDPETWAEFQKMVKNPSEIFKKLGLDGEDLAKFFEDDEKIEEARLQILKSLEDAGTAPTLAPLFGSEETMNEMLNDPTKWRDNVKKGAGGMAFGGQAAVGAEL